MLIKKIRYYLALILVCFSPTEFLAQENQDKNDLKEILIIIENQFGVKFSYQDNQVHGITVPPLDNFETLDDALRFLSTHTSLKFQIVDDRFIAVSSKDEITRLCGSIRDVYNYKVLDGATVVILNSEEGTITDASGNFSFFNVPLNSILKITFIGYEPVSIPARRFAERPDCSPIFLMPLVEELEEVVVVNYLTRGINLKRDGATELKPQQFGILPGLSEPDVLQTIQALPGIESRDESISNINIRGGTHDQNLILWDGIKMYHTGHFFGLISAFNPYLTEKVEIVKNGTSARFNDAVSSTINMQTRDNVVTDFSGGAGFNLISGDFFALVPISEKWSAQVSARRSVTDYINTPTFEQFFQRSFQDTEISNETTTGTDGGEEELTGNESFFFYDYAAKLLFDPSENDKIRISFIGVHNELFYDEFGETQDDTRTSSLDQTNIGVGGSWERNWNPSFSTEISGYYTQYNINAINYNVRDDQRLVQENNVLESGGKIHSVYRFNENLVLEGGYQFYELGVTNAVDVNNPVFFQTTKNVLRNHALFNEVTYETNKTFLKAGVRLNYAENFGRFIPEPRLNLRHEVFTGFSLKAMGEFRSQFISQVIDLREDFLGIDQRRWVLSDNNETPVITSQQASAGFDYKKNGWLLSAEAYYKEVEGITTRSQGFQDQNQLINAIGSYQIKGAELLINKKNQIYSIWLTYTFNENNYTFEDLVPDTFPNNVDIRHSVTLAGNYTYRNLKLAIGLNWRSGTPFTLPDSESPVNDNIVPARINYQATNSENLDDYIRADISAIYNFNLFPKIPATVGVSVLNVLNRENLLNTYFRLNENNEVQRIESRSLGITPNMSFRIRF
ncbi:carboxypeptidase-like regulatory domain-containing protein [Ascidiimonas aurantiaca]|uniref:carboxypeptidase-like regulatory domain-containing protein n=1 Tax=Ascidiimonas aurantiaca TaxID=1685432 RepID=UPI0030EBE097